MGMGYALVTGGFGFLGSWIVRYLLEDGVKVRVLARPGESRENLAGVDVDVIVEGDVCRPDDAIRAVADVDTVFHAAAIYSDWAPDPTEMYDVNLRGTFNVLEAARRAKVERVVYTASTVSLGRPAAGELANEESAYESWEIDFPYSRSKLFSRELAEYFSAWGLDVRVICPAVVLGPGDIRPTPSGKLILNIASGTMPPAYFEGGACYVDVRDAARAHIAAATVGKCGERYVVGAHNLSNRELIDVIQSVCRCRRRLLKLPTRVARTVARGYELQARRSGKPPIFSRDFFEFCRKPGYFDSSKAITNLGVHFRPIDETIAAAIAYFRQSGRL